MRINFFVMLLGLLVINSSLMADELDTSGVSISKDDISKSLDMLKSNGQFSAADIEREKEALKNMNDKDVNAITKKATDIVKKDPAAAEKMISN